MVYRLFFFWFSFLFLLGVVGVGAMLVEWPPYFSSIVLFMRILGFSLSSNKIQGCFKAIPPSINNLYRPFQMAILSNQSQNTKSKTMSILATGYGHGHSINQFRCNYGSIGLTD